MQVWWQSIDSCQLWPNRTAVNATSEQTAIWAVPSTPRGGVSKLSFYFLSDDKLAWFSDHEKFSHRLRDDSRTINHADFLYSMHIHVLVWQCHGIFNCVFIVPCGRDLNAFTPAFKRPIFVSFFYVTEARNSEVSSSILVSIRTNPRAFYGTRLFVRKRKYISVSYRIPVVVSHSVATWTITRLSSLLSEQNLV